MTHLKGDGLARQGLHKDLHDDQQANSENWSKIRYQLRPETSLPLDIKDTTAEASNWVSELQSSFKQMPAEAFEKPNKEFRRAQHRKQTSLPIGGQDNKTVQRSNG